MTRTLKLDREEALDSLVNVVPLAIIVALTAVFVAYNPWGWEETRVVALVFVLHAVPIVTLLPVTYLAVKIVGEAADQGRSPTAERLRAWFATHEEGPDHEEGSDHEEDSDHEEESDQRGSSDPMERRRP